MYEGKIKLIEYQGRELRFLNQRSRNWTHPYPYGENDDSTLSSAGCGIFSIAHVVEWFTGKRMKPESLADFSVENGGRGDDGTDRPALLGAMMAHGYAEQCGFSYQFDGLRNDLEALWAHMRAGNAALEEIVMAIKTRRDKFAPLYTDINLKEIYPSSRLVASITGIEPQPNKAIVGKNAFAHESGIHQDGVLKHKETYEIMHAEDIGLDKNSLVLGKHSGRHAFKDKLVSLGYELSNEQIEIAFNKFKALADSKKDVFDEDIRELVNDEFVGAEKTYEVLVLSSNSCNKGHASTALTLRYKDEILSDSALGNGGVDAIFKAIDRISGISGSLKEYQVKAVSQGKDALAKVTVKVEFAGEGAIIGRGLDVDTMLASAKAYVAALNTYLDTKR